MSVRAPSPASRYEISIPLVKDFCFLHEPIYSLINRRFVGRSKEIDELVHRLQHSAGGSFLITGYRGVGKTSFVNQVMSVLLERGPVLDIYVNLARPLTEAELMHLIIRRLYERLIGKDWYRLLSPELQRQITLAYQRTSANVIRKLSEGWERGAELGAPTLAQFKLPFSAKLTGKRSRNVDLETSFLAYDDKAAEHDVISIARTLALGICEPEAGWRKLLNRLRGASPSRLAIKNVFVFDEMDKLDDNQSRTSRAKSKKCSRG